LRFDIWVFDPLREPLRQSEWVPPIGGRSRAAARRRIRSLRCWRLHQRRPGRVNGSRANWSRPKRAVAEEQCNNCLFQPEVQLYEPMARLIQWAERGGPAAARSEPAGVKATEDAVFAAARGSLDRPVPCEDPDAIPLAAHRIRRNSVLGRPIGEYESAACPTAEIHALTWRVCQIGYVRRRRKTRLTRTYAIGKGRDR
jgi:hypothetical protein